MSNAAALGYSPPGGVPFLDLARQYRTIKGEIEKAFSRVAASQAFILGEEVERFERSFGAYLGSRYAVGVSSGTDALLAALLAAGVEAGDEVITTPFSFVATAQAIARLGATPVFADIRPGSFNLDPRRAEEALSPRTRAILPVHLFGRMAEMGPLVEVANQSKIEIIEDAAQAVGAREESGMAGVVGAYGCFSFYPSKSLGAFGDAGMVATPFSRRRGLLRSIREHGGAPSGEYARIGGNFRLDALQAAILSVKLRRLPEWLRGRAQVAGWYDERLRDLQEKGLIGLPRVGPGRHAWHQYVVRVSAEVRLGLQEKLLEDGVRTRVYYPSPLHLEPCFRHLGHRRGDFPEAERAAGQALALPIYPELTIDEVAIVSDRLTRALQSLGRGVGALEYSG